MCKDLILILNRWRGLAILAGEISSAVVLSSAPDLLLCLFLLANLLEEQRREAFSHRGWKKGYFSAFLSSYSSLSPSLLHPPPPPPPPSIFLFLSLSLSFFFDSFFSRLSPSLSRLLKSGRYHLSFCQLGDFNLLSFCAITVPRGPRKIVFNCDWLLSGDGRPPPFVPGFLHIPNCKKGASWAESRPNEIIPVMRYACLAFWDEVMKKKYVARNSYPFWREQKSGLWS